MTQPPPVLRAMATSAVRGLLIAGGTVLVVLAVWASLVAGLIAFLFPVMGLGWALLSVAGGLTVIFLSALGVWRLLRAQPSAPSSSVRNEMIALAMRALQIRRVRRLVLGVAGAVLLVSAVVSSPSDQGSQK